MTRLNPDGVFREIRGKQFVWTDSKGVTHACEGADVHRGVRLLWTYCERDIPANAAHFVRGPEDAVTCPKCIAIEEEAEMLRHELHTALLELRVRRQDLIAKSMLAGALVLAAMQWVVS